MQIPGRYADWQQYTKASLKDYDDGEIVQVGAHDELVNVTGKYLEMWNAQTQHFVKK